MSAYRKKPIEIEAMRWVSDMTDGYVQSVFDWLTAGKAQWSLVDNARGIAIATLEGEMRADDGDWIIRGVEGEFYPVKPSIFDAIYERVDARESSTGSQK